MLRVSILDGGRFDESSALDPSLAMEVRVPCWRESGPPAQRIEVAGARVLELPAGACLVQALAAYAPCAGSIELCARFTGRAELVLRGQHGSWASGERTGPEIRASGAELGGLEPRFVLELRSGPGGSRWSAIEASVELPCPSEADLAREIEARLHEALDPWLAHALDREGPRKTAFAPHVFDAVSGERLASYPSTLHPLFENLLEACRLVEDPRWKSALEAFVADYLELGLHPRTGLPRNWDALTDTPQDEQPVEVAAHLRFLLDVGERGPQSVRERALAAARRMAESIDAHARLPDGSLAASLRPSDGAPSSETSALRRLDVPAQLTRAARVFGVESWYADARTAIATFEFTHDWPGDWRQIDPGFDDEFGNYGARAVDMLQAYPEDPLLRRLAGEGYAHYAPIWRAALLSGGSIAADQVRCWDAIDEFAGLDARARAELPALLALALRMQWKGEQYAGGNWGDVTFCDFDPKLDLAVGDLPGLPANLLRGLAIAYDGPPELRTDDTRARFTAVLRSTVATYRRPQGYLSTPREVAGNNPASGSLRLAPGLLRMLSALKQPRNRSR